MDKNVDIFEKKYGVKSHKWQQDLDVVIFYTTFLQIWLHFFHTNICWQITKSAVIYINTILNDAL